MTIWNASVGSAPPFTNKINEFILSAFQNAEDQDM
jgi:hypothetical protein